MDNLSPALQWLSQILPLTHAVRLVRAVCFHEWSMQHLLDLAYMIAVLFVAGFFAIRRLRRKLVS